MNLQTWALETNPNLYDLNKEQKKQIEYLLHKVLLHQVGASEYKREIKQLLVPAQRLLYPELVQLRVSLVESSDVNTYYKIGLLDYLCNGETKGLKKWNVSPRYIQRFVEKYELTAPEPSIEKFSQKHQQEYLVEILPEVSRYIKNFSRRKLTFLANSNNFDLVDFEHDLQCQFLITYRWLYPFRSPIHLVSACKNTLHNSGLNILYKYTTGKRARLSWSENHGYVNSQCSLDADSLESELCSSLGLDNRGLLQGQEEQNIRLAMSQVCKVFTPEMQQAYSLLVTGAPPRKYLDYLESFFGVRISDYADFIGSIRKREGGNLSYSRLLEAIRRHCGLKRPELSYMLRVIETRVLN